MLRAVLVGMLREGDRSKPYKANTTSAAASVSDALVRLSSDYSTIKRLRG